PTRTGLRIFQAVLQDDTGLLTAAWPGQPWLDRKLREGDTLLVTGAGRFFHGRQLQPREDTVLGRGSAERRHEGVPGARGGREAAPTRGGRPHGDPARGGPGRPDAAGTFFVSYPASEEVPQWVL